MHKNERHTHVADLGGGLAAVQQDVGRLQIRVDDIVRVQEVDSLCIEWTNCQRLCNCVPTSPAKTFLGGSLETFAGDCRCCKATAHLGNVQRQVEAPHVPVDCSTAAGGCTHLAKQQMCAHQYEEQ